MRMEAMRGLILTILTDFFFVVGLKGEKELDSKDLEGDLVENLWVKGRLLSTSE